LPENEAVWQGISLGRTAYPITLHSNTLRYGLIYILLF